jgi:hypothetical protein
VKRKQRAQAPLSFRYVPVAKDGGLDQVLTVENHTEVSMVPTMAFVPYDIYGRELPHVTTTTVHGSDRGTTVVPAGGTGHDVLRFDGMGHHLVRGVQIHLTDLEQHDHPALEGETTAVMIDLDQKATLEPDEFWGIGLVNPNPFGVQLRVALLELEDRERDHPRQVADLVILEGDVDLASGSHDVIWLPEDVRGQFHAVDHHLVPQTYT